MDAIAEEHALGIDHEVLEVLALAVALIRVQHGLDGLAYLQVVLEVLVGKDVTATFRGFAQIIDVAFLLQRQLIPIRNLIAHNPQVGELIHQVLEFLFLRSRLFQGLLLFRRTAYHGGSHSNTDH